MSAKEGDLRVWWCPQIPMKSFYVDVSTMEEGKKLCEVLSDYDFFQFENNVKPDYCNTGGVERFEGDGEDGFDWFDVDFEEGEL